MRKFTGALTVALLAACMGCHTCDVCDDCGDTVDEHRASLGCSTCAAGGAAPSNAGYVQTAPARSAQPAVMQTQPSTVAVKPMKRR